ncbi:heme d1 biosynthesis protein NirJ [Anaerovibrio sp. JC8]|uniref:radical SAM/SPASM domain-containing protein n=1 Tax=Anaerovibrio sp. JC8 TaxID=1240085 RepID=UPI000A0CC7FA|nr:radical SAM protein [Anaerovibrio sp. JC8]ORT99728.1 heme d1 biosynthesis protein NirJ [Anaerovibrio sp. JC8]
MYYKLKDDLRLRGWELLPTGIVRQLSDEVSFMPTDVYRALQKACGSVPVNSPLFSPKEKKILDELLQEGILEETNTPVPLSPAQKYRVYPNRFLYSVHWSITGNCNCRCRHCYMSAPSAKIGEPSLEECLDVVRQMEAAGLRTVSLTGGEALLRKDFFNIVDALLEADILITTVMSNGLLVNEGILDKFEQRGIKPEFNMSFDGIDCHDWLRGIPGVEKAVKRAFSLCKERNFPTGAEYCLHKGNMDALRESVKLLGELGCQTLKVNRLSLEGEGLAMADKAITRDEEYQAYLDYIPQFYEDGAPLNIMLAGIFSNVGNNDYIIPCEKNLEEEDCDNYCLCGHARSHMYITPDGYMVPCIPMGSVEGGRRHFPNLKTTSLSSALQDSYYMDFIDMRLRDYFTHNPGCESCKYRNRCAGGCRGHVAAVGGGEDLLARDEDTCAFFRQGWYQKINELMASVLNKS